MKRIRVGDIEVAYDERGRGDRPFVLVHGFTGSRDDFADVLDPLARAGRTLAVDLRGHGDTSNPGRGYSLEQLTADLAGFLDAMEIERCDLLGHSLGGLVALRLALEQPERLHSLVLMDTSSHMEAPMPRWLLRAFARLARGTPARWLWRSARLTRHRLPPAVQRAAREMGPDRYWDRLRIKLEALDPVVYEQLLDSVFDHPPLTARLDAVRCPTLVLVGEEDVAFLPGSRKLAEGVPGARLIVIPEAHHSPQIEAREPWLRAVHSHLERARS